MSASAASAKKYSMDMTQGSIARLLIMFSLPLLLGNLFQELYNTVDSIVLGNFVSDTALAAVGGTSFICNTLVRFFNGISVGAGVVISRSFGAKDADGLHEGVQTTMTLSVVLGILISLVAIPYMPAMLHLTHTPEEVYGPALSYLNIYSAGILFLFVYNMGSSILRAVGDTKRPLYFLIATSLLNIFLDILFVVVFHWGIEGTAIATVVSEAASAVMVCVALIRTREEYRLVPNEPTLRLPMVRDICLIGLPTGIQQSLTSFGNTFVQGYINGLTETPILAGWSCHLKIDQFVLLPMQSIGQAATTFVGQNIGANKRKRAHKGAMTALIIALILMTGISVLIYIAAGGLVSLFNRDPMVIYYGVIFVHMSAPLRFTCAFNQTLSASLRGAGESTAPMLIMLGSFVAARQIYLFIVTKFVYNIYTVGFGFPIGWIFCSSGLLIYYMRNYKRIMKIDENTIE